jgi:hypothetical protein
MIALNRRDLPGEHSGTAKDEGLLSCSGDGSPARRLRAWGSARRRATAPGSVRPAARYRQLTAAMNDHRELYRCGRPSSSRAGIVSPRKTTGQGRYGLRPPRRCAMAQAPPWTADLPRRESAPIGRTGAEPRVACWPSGYWKRAPVRAPGTERRRSLMATWQPWPSGPRARRQDAHRRP